MNLDYVFAEPVGSTHVVECRLVRTLYCRAEHDWSSDSRCRSGAFAQPRPQPDRGQDLSILHLFLEQDSIYFLS